MTTIDLCEHVCNECMCPIRQAQNETHDLRRHPHSQELAAGGTKSRCSPFYSPVTISERSLPSTPPPPPVPLPVPTRLCPDRSPLPSQRVRTVFVLLRARAAAAAAARASWCYRHRRASICLRWRQLADSAAAAAAASARNRRATDAPQPEETPRLLPDARAAGPTLETAHRRQRGGRRLQRAAATRLFPAL